MQQLFLVYNLFSHFQQKHITGGHKFQFRDKVDEKESTN